MTTATLEPVALPVAPKTVHAPSHQRYPLSQGVNPWLVTASVMLPTFMEVLDTAIASVALPYIAGSLSASNSEATWVLDQLPGRQRRHPARFELVRAPLRPQELPAVLRGRLHRGRRSSAARRHRCRLFCWPASCREPAAARSNPSRSPSCWKVFRPEALPGHGGLRSRHRGRAGARRPSAAG